MTNQKHYTGDDYQSALLALLKVDEEFPRDHRPKDAAVTAILDAVAPVIAARVLRDFAEIVDASTPATGDDLRYRAAEIEASR